MPAVKISPKEISGPWMKGFALDYHSVYSVPTGDPYHPFDTKRTEIGELLYKYKYQGNTGVAEDIIDTVVEFLKSSDIKADCVCFAPASLNRAKQPVEALAEMLSKRTGMQLVSGATKKIKTTPPMKNVPADKRAALLADAIVAGDESVGGKSVLLLDDLYETGATSSRVCEVLLKDKKANSVIGLAITRTRN